MTAFGYARVSTDGQTLDAQLAAPKAAGAEGSHVPYKSPVELRAVYMPDAAWAVPGISQAYPGGRVSPRF